MSLCFSVLSHSLARNFQTLLKIELIELSTFKRSRNWKTVCLKGKHFQHFKMYEFTCLFCFDFETFDLLN